MTQVDLTSIVQTTADYRLNNFIGRYEIEKFAPPSEINVRYFDAPYYIIPDDEVGLEAFAVIRDAMASKKMVGIGRVVLRKRERPILLEAFGKGIRGMTLRYPYEVRSKSRYFEDILELKLAPDMLKLTEHIVDTKAAHFEPAEFVDRYEVEQVELLKTKQAGLPAKKRTPTMPRPSGGNIFDLLRRSVELEGKAKKRKHRHCSLRLQRRSPPQSSERKPDV